MSPGDVRRMSLWDLYRAEVESHGRVLSEGLLALEQQPADVERIRPLMRAAHSIKGAARVVRFDGAVAIAHAMEDRFVAAQEGRWALASGDIDRLLSALDTLVAISNGDEASRDQRAAEHAAATSQLVEGLRDQAAAARMSPPAEASPPAPPPSRASAPATGTEPSAAQETAAPGSSPGSPPVATPAPAVAAPARPSAASSGPSGASDDERVLRVTPQHLDRLVSLAGGLVVSGQRLDDESRGLTNLKDSLSGLAKVLEELELNLEVKDAPDDDLATLNDVQAQLAALRSTLALQTSGFNRFAADQRTLTDQLLIGVLSTRLRPFGELIEGMPRLVRDLSRELGKKVRLEIDGRRTDVDRDLAALLEAPLNHLLRNAIDHGIETPAERTAAGKPEQGTIVLSARHRGGMLRITITDDGRGVDVEHVKEKIVAQNLAPADHVERMGQDEIMQFLFLPGFSTATRVSEISGRGVGLDVVRDIVGRVGGHIRATSQPGKGVTFRFDLPLVVSILQSLAFELAGEPYALPITRVDRVLTVPREQLATVEGREVVRISVRDQVDDDIRETATTIGLVSGHQLLDTGASFPDVEILPVVVFRSGDQLYGLVVDRLLGERYGRVRSLDRLFGKVPDLSVGAIDQNGFAFLVLDADDLAASVEQVLRGGTLARVSAVGPAPQRLRRRLLVVDDSITVREVERQLLEARGFEVDVAIDGMDGWNAVRSGRYDLVVTDVDMPRVDGVELVRRIRGDERLANLPIVIVSYKDREEDRQRGLDAGANMYLTKSSFHDDTFVASVEELVGAPAES